MGISDKLKRAIKDPKKVIARTTDRLDASTGKKIFGNTIGIKQNIVGLVNRDFGKSDPNLKDSNPLAYQLRKDHFIMLGQPYDDNLIKKIKTKYERLMNDKEFSKDVSVHDGKVYKKKLITPEKDFPELVELLNEEIFSIVKGYLNSNFSIKNIDCWQNRFVPPEIGNKKEMFSNYWHCDRRNTDEIKLFVFMSDITEDDGPIHVVSKERTRELIDMGFGTRENYNLSTEILEDPKYVSLAIGPIGTAFLANPTVCFHRAGEPSPGHQRNMIDFCFTSSKDPLPENWIDYVERTP